MTHFSEKNFKKRMTELNCSQQSIQTLSLWLLHHRKHAPTIVGLWQKHLAVANADRKLVMMYLANDVVQTSKRKGPEYTREFGKVVANCYSLLLSEITDEKIRASLARMVKIWTDRKVFPPDVLDGVKLAVEESQKSSAAAAAPAESAEVADATKPAATAASVPAAVGDEDVVGIDDVVYDITGSPKIPETGKASNDGGNTSATLTAEALKKHVEKAPETDEMIALINRLNDSATADAQARNNIAQLPPEVADPKALESIKDEVAAEALGKKIEKARTKLTDYNRRLAEEMVDRQKLAELLPAFLDARRALLQQRKLELKEMQAKWKKKEELSVTLKQHFENLPDLGSQDLGSQPLPSAGDLFKS